MNNDYGVIVKLSKKYKIMTCFYIKWLFFSMVIINNLPLKMESSIDLRYYLRIKIL